MYLHQQPLGLVAPSHQLVGEVSQELASKDLNLVDSQLKLKEDQVSFALFFPSHFSLLHILLGMKLDESFKEAVTAVRSDEDETVWSVIVILKYNTLRWLSNEG